MKICIVGATGGVGHYIVKEALAAGHEVRAVVRSGSSLDVVHENLTVVTGNILDEASLAAAFAGCDAVISAIGSMGRKPTRLYSQGALNLLAAMAKSSTKRLFVLSAAGLALDSNDSILIRLAKPLVQFAFKQPYIDMRRMEEIVRASAFDWTIVRQVYLTDKPGTGQYRLAIESGVPGGWSIARSDVARGIVEHLGDPEFRKKRINIAS